MDGGGFWSNLDALVASSRIVVDRPRGSRHGHPAVAYPYDYGYLAGTISGDGEGVDVWIGSCGGTAVTAVVCTVDRSKRDVELKLLLGCSAAECEAILAFHNSGDRGVLVVRDRPGAVTAPGVPPAGSGRIPGPGGSMGEFVRAIAAADLPPGSCAEVRVKDKAVALYNVGGAFYASSNTCVHRGGPLGQGMLEGAVVMCPWHAWTFDVTTGRSTVNPELGIATFEVKVEAGQVLVKVD